MFNPFSDRKHIEQLELEYTLQKYEESIHEIFNDCSLDTEEVSAMSGTLILLKVEAQHSDIPKLMSKYASELTMRLEDLLSLEIDGWFYYKGNMNSICFQIKEY